MRATIADAAGGVAPNAFVAPWRDIYFGGLMKRFNVLYAVAILAAFACASLVRAEDKTKTVSGKSECATCSGVTASGHNIMLVDDKGARWVLVGDSDSYKAASKVRKDDKKMTATLAGDPVSKKDENGKEYKEVKVSDVKVES